MTRARCLLAPVSLLAALSAPLFPWLTTHAAAGAPAAGGLSVFVGYAEDKEINTPDPAAFPTPWAGAPNTTFLGGTVPGQTACGTLTVCYDAGAIRLDNPGASPVTVGKVVVDDHSSVPGGKVFSNLWGSFTVPAGKSVILTENPPNANPSSDNFDTSSYPPTCTPVTVAPTVTFSIGGTSTTLVDSAHVLDTGGVDAGSCSPKHNESVQWRPIGVPGSSDATLTLGPGTATQFAGQPTTETASVLDGSGTGIPNTTVNFAVTRGPDAGLVGSAVTDGNGQAEFTYAGASPGEDAVTATVTTVGRISSNTTQVLWTNGSASGWSGADIGSPTPGGGQAFDPGSGTWTVQGGGAGIGGTADQFRFVWQAQSAGGGIGADVAAQSDTADPVQAGVMARAGTDPGAPFYGAFATSGGGIAVEERSSPGAPAVTVASAPGGVPAYLWVVDTGGAFTAYGSDDGFTWTPVAGSTASLDLGPSYLVGLAVSSDDGAQLDQATIDDVITGSAAPPPPPPVACPGPWSCGDVGSPALAGSQSYVPAAASWSIVAGGTDITGTSDQFHFVWRTLAGDGSLSARVATQSNSSSNAKAGVMLRVSTDPASPNYAVVVSPGAGIKVQERSVQGGQTTKLANPTGTAPAYLRVSRSGNTFTAYSSADGVTWTLIPGSTYTMALPPTVLAGLAVTSHNAGVLGTVTMDAVAPG